ncbi:MAG: hypothetical protein J0J01_03505 [Reyranella sp.]|uniref:hypothetical protein n=1 Tax=Reyranella sp. TaxID=1929291 RepID=UPI001AD13DCC|nr:hypothetical protein [Reyranella sp.]MBN9085954.1 hypothetical protein [Reyranella sp.]
MDIPTGTLDKFHLGVSADGQTCMMVFVDEDQRTIRCVADFSEFNAFIANLNRAAAEMSRRRHDEGNDQGTVCGTMNVAFAEFQLSPTDEYIEGALVGDAGQIVGIRMAPEVACQLTKAMLMTAPAASRC